MSILGMFGNEDDKKDNSEDNNKSSSEENKKNSSEQNNNDSSQQNSNDSTSENQKTSSDKNREVVPLENLKCQPEESKQDSPEREKLRLHKEELSINKNMVHTGDVELSTEIIEEKKSMDIPITCEEVVIERKSINNEVSDKTIGSSETIKIPVSEERVEVQKRTVVTGEVSAYKRKVENTQHIETTLKSEEPRIVKVGNPNIVSQEKSNTSN